MGTFHDDLGELHGITVVVETTGPRLYVGRCHEENHEVVILLDADHHEEGESDTSREDYLKKAFQFGVWKKHDRITIPRADVRSIRRLGEPA